MQFPPIRRKFKGTLGRIATSLLESVDTLILFAQKRDVYIRNLVEACFGARNSCVLSIWTMTLLAKETNSMHSIKCLNAITTDFIEVACKSEPIVQAFGICGESKSLYAMHGGKLITHEMMATITIDINQESTSMLFK